MQVHSYHDVVAAHDGNVVVRDWVLPAIGHGEEKGLEGHFIEEVSYLSRRDHVFLIQYLATLWSISSDQALMPPLTLFKYLNPCSRRKCSARRDRTPLSQWMQIKVKWLEEEAVVLTA